MNKKKSVKVSKINVFDVAAVILVVFMLLCTYISINNQKFSMLLTPYNSAEITLELNENDSDFYDSVKVGDSVYFYKNG